MSVLRNVLRQNVRVSWSRSACVWSCSAWRTRSTSALSSPPPHPAASEATPADTIANPRFMPIQCPSGGGRKVAAVNPLLALRNAGHDARVMTAVLTEGYLRPRPRATEGPLVTVVISAYNRSEVLRFALASAVAQTYRRLDVLVVGDACTDGSEAVVAAVGDPRVRWINLERNSGSQAGPN